MSTTSGAEDVGEVDGGNMQADWLRLKRGGETIAAYGSIDGENWTRIGRLTTDNIDLSASAYIGLAVTSHDEGTLCTARYRSLSGISPGSNRDIGDVEVAGGVSIGEGIPIVTAASPTDVTATSATLNGSLDDLGGASSADVYFEYREEGADSWTATSTQTLSSTGPFSQKVSGLTPQQKYEYRAIADTADGDSVTSSIHSFETPSIVTMESVTDVTADSATFTGSADFGGISAAEVYFEYRELNIDSWTATEVRTLTSSGSFSLDVSGLTSRRYFEIRAVLETDDLDPVTSSILTFGTPSHANGGPPNHAGPSSRSQFDIDDGFASAAEWLDHNTPVIKVREPTKEQLGTALDVDGERLIVFETSGSIDLGGDGISVEHGKFYIAGQTAPSPGITLFRGGLLIDADDFVVQHIRARRGDDTPESGAGDTIAPAENRQNMVFDHITATWGTDETLSITNGTKNVTMSNCIIAEGLRNSQYHSGGNGHSAGSLIGSGYENVSLMGNLWASNLTRNPRLQSGTSVVVNNVSYDYRHAIGCSSQTTSSIVGNVFLRGNVEEPVVYRFDPHAGDIYVEDNYSVPDYQMADDGINQVNSSPLWPEGLEALPSEEVQQHVFENVGARPADRTYHDRRIIHNVVNWEVIGDNLPGSASEDHAWIDHEEIIGDYPELSVNTHSLDVPESGTWAWLRSWARRVETPPGETYEDEDGPGIIDDFEDTNIEEYVGAIGHYEVNDDQPIATGTYSLKNTSGSDAVIASYVDLPRYPQAGDTFAAKVAGTETTSTMGIAFGITSTENFYFVRYWPGSEVVQFYRVYEGEWSTPEYTKLAESERVSVETGEIYEFVVDWGIDGDISVELLDSEGRTVTEVVVNDSTHIYGGFGTRRTGMLDDVRIL